MKDIKFYEVQDVKDRVMGIYSPELDFVLDVGCNAFNMAQINARHHGGKIFEVNSEGERELVWPK